MFQLSGVHYRASGSQVAMNLGWFDGQEVSDLNPLTEGFDFRALSRGHMSYAGFLDFDLMAFRILRVSVQVPTKRT